MEDSRLKKVYDTIVKEGYDVPDFATFETDMRDDKKLTLVRDRLVEDGYELPDFEQFKVDMFGTPASTPASPTFTAEQPHGMTKAEPEIDGSAWETYKDVGAVKPAVQSGEKETLTTFGEGVKQGADAIYQGNKYFAGEQARFWNGAQQDAKMALEFLDAQGEDFDAKGWDVRKAMDEVAQKQWEKDYAEFLKVKEARRKERKEGNMGMWERILHKVADPSMPEPLEARRINPTNMSYQRPLLTLNDALKEADGDIVKAREILEKKASEEQWADKTMREASEAMAKHKPVEGAAWWGQMVPQVAGQAVAIGANFIPGVGGVLGKTLSIGTTTGLTMSSAGQAMAEARRAGASDDEVWSAGVAQAVIEAGSEQIPLNRLIGKTGSAAFKKGYKAIAGNIPEKELEKLLVEGNKRLGGKLLSGKNAKEFIKDMGVEGASEFVAEFLGTYVPVIYEDKENYPTLLEAVKNGWEGAKGGFAMGGFLGGGSMVLTNRMQENRRKKQGFVKLATDKDGNVVEVIGEKDGMVTVLTQDGATEEHNHEDLNSVGSFTYDEWKNAKVDIEQRENEAARKKAFAKGYNEPAVNTGDALNVAEQEAKTAMGLNTEESIEDFMDGRSIDEVVVGDEDLKAKLNNYFQAKAEDEGRRAAVEEMKATRYAEVDAEIDGKTNTADGALYSTTLPTGENIVITGGKVVLDGEGYIDVNQSEGLVALMPDGTKMPVRVDELREKIEVSNAEELKASKHAEIDAEIEAELSAPVRSENTVSNENAQEVDDNAVDVATETPVAGKTQQVELPKNFRLGGKNYTVLSRNEDGSVNAMLDGKRTTLPADTDFAAVVPTDNKGNIQFTDMPVEKTLDYIAQRVSNGKARAQMIENNRKQAENALKKFDKEPNVGTDPDAYEATMNKWEADKKAAQEKVDYWNEVAKRDAEISRSEMREAVEAVKPRDVVEKTADEFVASVMPKITPESFKAETGLSNTEQKSLVGIIASAEKGGVTIEQAAESILENYGDELRGLGFNGDVQDMRDVIINILSTGNPRSYAKKGLEMRQQADIEQQMQELESVANALGFETIDEQIKYEEVVVPSIIQKLEGFDETEYFNNLAENIEYDTTGESEGTRGSSELLQGKQSADDAGTGNIAGPGQGGEVHGDVYSGGENAAPQGNQQVNGSEIPNSSTGEVVSPVEGVAEDGNSSVPSQQTPVNNLNENNDGREEITAADNSGAQLGREELSDTEQVGAGVPVQDTARNSKSKRRNAGVGSSKLGNGPQYDVNRNYTNEEIEEIVSSVTDIVDGKVVITGEVADDIKAIVRGYESGGIAKKGRGILDEYYTDGKIVDAVNMLIAPYFSSSTPIRVLEPSIGIGNFIQAVNNIPTSEVVAFEINETTARIAKILYPDVDVNLRSFETEFIDESGNKKPMPQKYSLVIGNPPYGSHRGLYKGLGEESKIARYEDYFVKRSLDVLDEGGVLAMVLPSSWMDRHTKFGGYTIERAYRLPSGAFEATQVGTDIVILKKDSSIPVTEHVPYFEQFPERVLGEVKQRKGRYGRLEEYVEGDIDAAIEAIKKENAEQVADLLDIEKNNDALNDIESAIDETGSTEKAVDVVKDAQNSEKADNKPTTKLSGKQDKYKVELNRGAETVPTSSQFTHEFSEGEVEAFADTDYEGALSNPAKHRRYANYIGGQAIHDFYYAEGDIYSKLAQLEQEKHYIVENYGAEQYEKQKALLESVLPKQKSLEEITISPNTTFVKNLNILTEGGRVSLKDMFVDFLRKLPHQAFGNSSSWEVVGYINNEQVHGTDKQRNQLVRERRKRAANDLFNKFLNEELSDNAKKQVIAAFNREYNSTYRPDYSKVPMFSTINRDFNGKPLKLTSVQLAGIGRMTVKGVGVLAHEVGFGKTLSGILAMHEAMTRGFAKKPLIVVPNDNILKQWVETIGEVLPSATVNTLGNLGAGYDLTDFKVNDGEFTIITYEGLKAMSFSDGTYNHLASKFSYITEDLNKHQSERDIQKDIEKKNELKGKMKRGTKSAYMFEDFGFDWLTVDEVHNANHIVSKVRLDKSVASDFRSQSQRTSDLGLKTWLAAQYIQEENNGRNVLLLSATPFTNKPLEYYSVLSLVGNDMLERKGFFNVDQFFATFMEADNELEIGANGRPTQKTNVRRFRNNGLFQQLLSEFIDIKGEEDNPELVRPERLNKEYKIAQNELTVEAMAAAQELLSDNDTVLQGIGHARAAAFSPYATSLLGMQPKNHKEFVKNSPKIDATIKMIEQNIKDRPDAGQIIYSEVGVEYFPLIRDYLVKESGLKPSEVRIITGATSNNERVNIQSAFNNGEVKVVVGSPAIKEGLNLQGNTTDMYILSLPWNFTQLRQVEGRGWRQGNKWENIRINYMLTNDSVDVFMLQRLQLKQGLYNEAMKSGAESLDVSDIDTADLKTALITDPAVRAEIVTVQERAKLQQEKTQIEADLSFVMRKYEAYNKLVSKLESQKNTIKMYREWAKKGDEYWAQRVEREEAQLTSIENEIEEEKQNLIKKGVNVDDIVRQTQQSQNDIAAIQEKIDNLKEFQEELTQKFREESEAKAKEQGDLVSTYIKERKAENKGGFYKIRPVKSENKAVDEDGLSGINGRQGEWNSTHQRNSGRERDGGTNKEGAEVVNREGEGSITDREVVMDSDPYSKALGRPRYTGRKMGEYVARQRMEMAKRVKALAQKLNLNIDVLESTEGLSGKRAKAKGWYEPKGKRIVVVIPNHSSVNDAVATVLHEAVAHHGLRELFGENFDTFLQNVYNNADADVREAIETLAAQRYNGNLLTATEEYLASLAENTDFEYAAKSGWWERIKDYFFKMLRGLGIEGFDGIALTDNELRYILWRSYQNLANPGMYNNVFGRVKDTALQYELKVGDYAPAVQNGSMVAGEDIDNSYTELSYEEAQDDIHFRVTQEALDVVNEFNTRNRNTARVIFADGEQDLREQLSAWDFAPEDIEVVVNSYKEGFLASYFPEYDKVLIYKHDVSQKELNGYLWHENAHRAVEYLFSQEEMEEMFLDMAGDKIEEERAGLLENGYEEAEQAEEYIVRVIEEMYLEKPAFVEQNRFKAVEGAREGVNRVIPKLKKIIDFIQNGNEEDSTRRGRVGSGLRRDKTEYQREVGRGDAMEMRNAGNKGGNAQEATTAGGAELLTSEAVQQEADRMDADEVVVTASAVKALAQKLNTNVNIVEDSNSLPENLRAKKGWYDPKTGEVVVVMDNHVSMEDALQTVLHEIVGHRGLQVVLGDRMGEFLNFVYNNLPKNIKSRVNNYVISQNMKGNPMTQRQAVEEYIAELAERGFEGYNGLWNGIRQWFRDFFRNFMNIEVTDGELRYMLWKNYQRLQVPNVLTKLQERVMQDSTNTDDSGLMFRSTDGGIKAGYEKAVTGWWNKFKQGYYDQLRAVRKAQELIAKTSGKKIADSEDVYSYAEHLPSINKIMAEQFDMFYMKPFTELLKKLHDKMLGGVKIDDKMLERYANAKHGLERNREMAVKKALTSFEEVKGKKRAVLNEKGYDDWKGRKADIFAKKELSWEEKQRELDKLAKTFGAKLGDYSGITAIFDPEGKMKYKELSELAIGYVNSVEQAIGKGNTDEFWKQIKGMTKYSLEQSYKSGLISKDTYDIISGLYSFYVPLRGFTEQTAEDIFDYVAVDHSPLSGVLRRAEGRKSEADNIFATIVNMAHSSIVMGNKNKMKQMALNLAMRHSTPLLSVDNAWYAKVGDEYIPQYPDIKEGMDEKAMADAFAEFEARMKEMEKNGEVVRHAPGLNIKERVVNSWNEQQHAIRVKRNGKEYVVWVNGSPTFANAINGMLKDNDKIVGMGWLDAVNSFRSKAVTQYSPTFIFTNLFRDVQSASMVYGVLRGRKALAKFEKNLGVNSVAMMKLYSKYKSDTLDMNNEQEKFFKEFLENGGETGYTEMISIEEYQKMLNKLTEKLNVKNATGRAFEAVGDGIEFANRCVENLSRFSAYMTSRQMGMSIMQSVNDAKEVSVNFNRRGSGEMGAKVARKWFMFFNPAVQSVAQRILLAEKYPKRMVPILAAELAAGAALPYLFASLSALLGFGPDDEEDDTFEERLNRRLGNYYNLTDYRRRSSICFPTAEGVVNIPLSHEARVFFGAGELVASIMTGHEVYDNIPSQLMNVLGQSLPFNPVEGWNFGEGLGETLMYNLTPDAIKPFVEVGMNRDFAGNRIHNRTDYNRHLPEWMRGRKGTTEVYKAISRGLSGDESDFGKNVLDENIAALINPSNMEHLVTGYLGGVYTFLEKSAKSAQWALGDEEYAEFRNIPIVSSFYTSMSKYEEKPAKERTRRDWEDAFKYYQKEVGLLDDKEKAVKNGIKQNFNNAQGVLDAMKNDGDLLVIDVFNDGYKVIKELYSEADVARSAKDMERLNEINNETYAHKRALVERMEQMAENPLVGYGFLVGKEDTPYGRLETYGDLRDAQEINEMQKKLKVVYDEYKHSENKGVYKTAIDLYDELAGIERQISKIKKLMTTPEKDMGEIRKLRSEAMNLIRKYNE